MNIDLSIVNFTGESATYYKIRYARIDNISTPVYNQVAGNITAAQFPYSISDIENGQYSVGILPVYSDQRTCQETFKITSACQSIIALNAARSGGNLEITYTANGEVPQVLLTVSYPNGGSFQQIYTNGANDSTILVPLPVGLTGNYLVYMQSVCDPDTNFYSPLSSPVTVAVTSGDSLTLISNSGTVGSTRTQIFKVGDTVTSGVTYYLIVYSHEIDVTAVGGDTPSSIATKLAAAINATTETEWDSAGSAPAHGTTGFPPTASASSNQITIILNYSNQFTGGVSE